MIENNKHQDAPSKDDNFATVTALCTAVQAGDGARVKEIIRIRPALATTDLAEDNENRALHFAVKSRQVEIVRILMAAGADPNQGVYPHRDASTPLVMSRDRGFDDVVSAIEEELTRRSYTAQAPSGSATMPSAQSPEQQRIHDAVVSGDIATVRRLAAEHPELILPDVNRENRLLVAAVRENNLAMVEALLDLGADPNDRHRLENLEEDVFSAGSPLWRAADESRYEIAQLLLKRGADPNAMVYASGHAMHRALNNRDKRMQEMLIQYGMVMDPIDATYEDVVDVPLKCLEEHPERVDEMIIAAACAANLPVFEACLPKIGWPRDDRSWFWLLTQPMSYWRCHPHRKFTDIDRSIYPRIFEQILDHGIDPNIRGKRGFKLLHETATCGVCWGNPIITEDERVVFARALLDRGADIDPVDDDLHSTPLGWAARWGRLPLAELLLSRGAAPNPLLENAWAMPLAWANRYGNTQIAELLKNHGAHE